MPDQEAAPRLVVTAGLHASASTWVFNVTRELLIDAFGEARVFSMYGEQADEVPDEATLGGRRLVLKTHHGSPGLDALMAARGAFVLLSLRDPRDAAISMAQRFSATLEHAAVWLGHDCKRLTRLAAEGHPLLRYEDRFFDDANAPARLAGALGLRPSPRTVEAIFARHATDSVRAFARDLAVLPPGRVIRSGASSVDSVTQIHGTHIGDGRTGKWRDLPAAAQSRLTEYFRPFLERFGYEI